MIGFCFGLTRLLNGDMDIGKETEEGRSKSFDPRLKIIFTKTRGYIFITVHLPFDKNNTGDFVNFLHFSPCVYGIISISIAKQYL